MFAAENFRFDGWWSGYGLPNYAYPSALRRHESGRYTHYPQLVNVPMVMALQKLGMGLKGIQAFHVLLSCGALALFFLSVQEVANPLVALIAMVVVGFSVVWLEFMDSLVVTWDEFIRYACIALLVFSDRPSLSRRSRQASIVAAWLAYLFQSLATYEYVVGLGLFIFTYTAATRGLKSALRRCAVFAMGPALGFSIHALQVIAFLGPQGAWSDARTQFLFRTLNHGEMLRSYYHLGALNKGIKNGTGVWGISWIIQSILLVGYLLLHWRPKELRRILGFLFGLWACGLAWYVIFPQSTHNFMVYMPKHILPALALGLAIATACVIRQVRPLGNPITKAPRWMGPHAPEISYALLLASVLVTWVPFVYATAAYARAFPNPMGPRTYPPGFPTSEYARHLALCDDVKKLGKPGENRIVVARGVFNVSTTPGRFPIVSAVDAYLCDSEVYSFSAWRDLPDLIKPFSIFYGDGLVVYLIAKSGDSGWAKLRIRPMPIPQEAEFVLARLGGGQIREILATEALKSPGGGQIRRIKSYMSPTIGLLRGK